MKTDRARRVLVTGASRGLGLEFTRQLLARGEQVHATCREPARADALQALAAGADGRLQVSALDVADPASRAALAAALESQGEPLDLLVNNAGVLPSGERFGELDQDTLMACLATNIAGPLLLAQALAPRLAAGHAPLVLNISSGLGSITRVQGFRTPSYAISKAGLNMAGVLLAQALKPMGIAVLNASPGWVRTDMGGDGADLAPAESVRDLLALADRRAGDAAGEFTDRHGTPLPW